MDFFAKLSLNTDIKGDLLSLNNSGVISEELNTVSFIGAERHQFLSEGFHAGRVIFLGDPIFHSVDHTDVLLYLENHEPGKAIRCIDGFYFLLVYYENERKLIVASGPFSILPVYYMVVKEVLIISSSFDRLVEQIRHEDLSFNEQYYLEKALFNYPLFDRTPVSGIKTLSTNSFLEYKCSSFRIQRHTFIHDFFVTDPVHWKEATDALAELFIRKASVFIPKENAIVTLTGGFDSRTILGIALGSKGLAGTYSYGSPGERDACIASEISERLNIRHFSLVLDENYAKKEFWDNAVSFVNGSYGLGNLSRAHYNYALKTSLKDAAYLLSGDFGSELMRSMKVPGVVTSASLLDMFNSDNPVKLAEKLLSNPGLKYLNNDIVKASVSNLVSEIVEYKESLPARLTTNQMFYTYLFEEVFRKYFGAEIVVQRNYLNHRAPFLCFSFMVEILKTGLAGANSDFLESNPLRRYQGQILYAKILNEISPLLSNFLLDRGYRPRDLLSLNGQVKITSEYLFKKIIKKRQPVSPDHLTVAFKAALPDLSNIKIEEDLFNGAYIAEALSGKWINDQTNFNNMMSAALYYQTIRNDK